MILHINVHELTGYFLNNYIMNIVNVQLENR